MVLESIRKCWRLALSWILFVCSQNCFAVLPASQTSTYLLTNQQLTLTFNDLLGTKGFILRGLHSDKIIYFPISPQWRLNQLHLHLDIYHVNLVQKLTGLTFYVNDVPLSSLNLTGNGSQLTTWDIDVPTNLLKGDILNFQISSDTPEQSASCFNLTNPFYWTYFTGDSVFNINYDVKAYEANLGRFPYPFIKNTALYEDQIVLALPDELSLSTLKTGFYLANELYKLKTWRGLKIFPFMLSGLSADIQQNNNIIVVGRLDALPKELSAALPFNQIPPAQGAGVLYLSRSPWNPINGLLIVTGVTDAGLYKAANVLNDLDYLQTATTKNFLFINSISEREVTASNFNQIMLSGIGYQNQTMFGSGENTLNYSFDTPIDKKIKALIIELNYAVSPFISKLLPSYLTLKLNGIAVGGIMLQGKNSTQKLRFKVNNKVLLIGKNTLTLDFNLKLRENECRPEDANLAWVTIYKDSTLNFTFTTEKIIPSFESFFAATTNLTILLPRDLISKNTLGLYKQLILLSGRMPKFQSLNIFWNSDLSVQPMQYSQNIFYMGNLEESKEWINFRKKLPFFFLKDQLIINPLLKPQLTLNLSNPIALVQVVASPYNDDAELLTISSLSMKGYLQALDVLSNPNKYSLLKGDVALIYADGTFTSILAQQLMTAEANNEYIHSIGYKLYIGFMLFVATITIILIFFLIGGRLRHYFSANIRRKK